MKLLEVLQFIWHHPSNRGRRLQAVTRGIGWQLYKRTTRRHRDLPVYGDLRLRCYPSSHGAGIMIYTHGWPDYDEMHFMRAYLRPGDTFVDIGANIGIYTLLAASLVHATGKVISFEAGRAAFAQLQDNVARNHLDHVQLRFEAIGPHNGTIRFLQNRDLVNRLMTDADQQAADCRFEEVPCVTLDRALDGNQVAMGKMDIEGAEPLAFQSAQHTMATANPPVWLLELKDRLLGHFDTTAEQFARFLTDHGYQLGIYQADQRQLIFPDQPWREHENVLAIHHSATRQVQERIAMTP